MEFIRRWAPISLIILIALSMQWYVTLSLSRLLRHERAAWWKQAWMIAWSVLLSLWLAVGVPLLIENNAHRIHSDTISWLLALSLFWMLALFSAGLWLALRGGPEADPSRRRFLAQAAPVIAAVPLVTAGFGIVSARNHIHAEEVTLRIAGLPKDLDGLRVAHLSDIHFGPFFGKEQLERAVALANEARPHLVALTGDLITRHGDDMEGCFNVLRGLRSEAGVFCCHGNHEVYAGVIDYADQVASRLGFRTLREASVPLRFGASTLNLAGFDYQKMGVPYLPGAEKLVLPGAFNLLLQHNPDVFPRAAAAGFDLTLAGHTHGGQINVEILHEHLSMARFFTPYVRGKYEKDGKLLYVTTGLGTVAVPVRIGASPEVAVIRLCAV